MYRAIYRSFCFSKLFGGISLQGGGVAIYGGAPSQISTVGQILAFLQLHWTSFACSVFFCFGLSALFLVLPKVDSFMDMVLVKVVYGDP